MANIKSLYNKGLEEKDRLKTSGESSIINNNAPTNAPTESSGSGWVNLNKYLEASKGEGKGIADAVTDTTQKDIDSAAGKINEWQSKASQVDSGQINELDSLNSQIKADPTKVDSSKFKQATSNPYKAPTLAEKTDGYNDAWKGVNNAGNQYKNLISDDWGNRATNVTDTFRKNNQYTKGMGILDTFVLNGDQAGQQAISNFANKNKSFLGEEKDGIWNGGALDAAKGSVQQKLDENKSKYDSFLGSNGVLNNSIRDKRGELIARAENEKLKKEAQDLSNSNNAVVQKLGANGLPQDATGYYNKNKNFSWKDAVSDVDLAALNSLSGLDNSEVIQKGSNNAYDVNWNALDKYIGDENSRRAAEAKAKAEAETEAAKVKAESEARKAEEKAKEEVSKSITPDSIPDVAETVKRSVNPENTISDAKKAASNPVRTVETVLDQAKKVANKFKLNNPWKR